MSVKKVKSNVEMISSPESKNERSAKHYLYVLLVAFLLIIGSSVGVYAQTNPSGGASNNNTHDYGDNRPNYNYLGLLGLLGLYGLHKVRARNEALVDRRKL